jgi:hypothetical protein
MENSEQGTSPTSSEGEVASNPDVAVRTSSVPATTPPNTPRTSRDENINTDGKAQYDWQSKWPQPAKSGILRDSLVVGIIFFGTLIAIFLTWHGLSFEALSHGCNGCSKVTFNKYSYFFLGGMLGGTLFGLKFLYMVVARGYWTEDRWLWRIFTPFLSGGLALAFGAMLDSGIFGLSVAAKSNPSYLSIGFITETVFGKASRHQKVENK